MAISKVDLENGVMRLLHRFSTLSKCIENAVMPNQGVQQPGVPTLLDILSMGQARKKGEFRCDAAILLNGCDCVAMSAQGSCTHWQ